MSYRIADNIISPLGETSGANYQQAVQGRSMLRRHEGLWHLPYPVQASMFSEEQKRSLMAGGLTWFESLAYRSAHAAWREAQDRCPDLDAGRARTILVLSTTKADISELEHGGPYIPPGESARRIAAALALDTEPLVVCNACVSGLSALITADRLLRQGSYDYAIVCGCDVLSAFIVSGFQSLGALSPEPCRPFDIDRIGLNLGEAAATVILSARKPGTGDAWQIADGRVRNDAYHISAPDKSGSGLAKALRPLVAGAGAGRLAFISAHGTATLFNDAMEAAALRRSGLADVLVYGLKGYFGHTMGASGLLETILSMQAADGGLLPGTRGFAQLGVSGGLRLSADNTAISGHSFIKMLSGFGGCNAAMLCTRGEARDDAPRTGAPAATHSVHVTPGGAEVDGARIPVPETGASLLTAIYKRRVGGYPKYYKMDGLSRLGFIAAELLLQAEGATRFKETDSRGVALFCRSSSIGTDRRYLDTIRDRESFYPSPSLFAYTLPNIVTGEIAIRNRYHGETCLYLLAERDRDLMSRTVASAFLDPGLSSLVTGWLDYEDDSHFEADLSIVEGPAGNGTR